MQNMMPLLRKSMDSMNQRLQEEIVAMEKEYSQKGAKPAPQTNN
jgi:hypothetical protein